MGLLHCFMVLLISTMACIWSPSAAAAAASALSLDALLQDYAYRAFVRPRTGVFYNGDPPSNLTGIQISAMRLRSGSLRIKGVGMYKEFQIPSGVVVEHPYTERLVLVYQNLGNWSMFYYPLPGGYTYLAPVLGLLAYDASDLSAKNLPKLDIEASGQPISIKFSEVKTVPRGSVAKCVCFDSNDVVSFSSLVAQNTCSTSQQGHFSIVVESISPLPPAPEPAPHPRTGPISGGGGNESTSMVWIILGSALGAFLLLLLLGLLVPWFERYNRRKKMLKMEKASEIGEALHMTSIGITKAPAAAVTRTRPMLEPEHIS